MNEADRGANNDKADYGEDVATIEERLGPLFRLDIDLFTASLREQIRPDLGVSGNEKEPKKRDFQSENPSDLALGGARRAVTNG